MNPFGDYNCNYVQNYNYNSQIPMTNVTFVTSLEEALYRASSKNTDMVFFHQDRPVFYRIKIDNDGRKSWAEFNYSTQSQNENSYVTQSEFRTLSERLAAIEASLTKEVISNE